MDIELKYKHFSPFAFSLVCLFVNQSVKRGRERKDEEKDQRGRERERERDMRDENGERRDERECGSHNDTAAFNCHVSYLKANLTVLSRQRLK